MIKLLLIHARTVTIIGFSAGMGCKIFVHYSSVCPPSPLQSVLVDQPLANSRWHPRIGKTLTGRNRRRAFISPSRFYPIIPLPIQQELTL